MGFTGFTLVMPFLPLFIRQLGVTDVGEIAVWTGLCLGVTPAVTAVLSPWWGRLADRHGRKIMVERSLVSFVVMMAAMAYVTRAWHVLALRVAQGLFAGAGRLLQPDGRLFLYGPFMRDGAHTAPSNAAFDASLRAQDPAWGVRDLAAVSALADLNGLVLSKIVEMPANNLTLVFARGR